jgi:hypothetical protein
VTLRLYSFGALRDFQWYLFIQEYLS